MMATTALIDLVFTQNLDLGGMGGFMCSTTFRRHKMLMTKMMMIMIMIMIRLCYLTK